VEEKYNDQQINASSTSSTMTFSGIAHFLSLSIKIKQCKKKETQTEIRQIKIENFTLPTKINGGNRDGSKISCFG
jgi:hypothetical protein